MMIVRLCHDVTRTLSTHFYVVIPRERFNVPSTHIVAPYVLTLTLSVSSPCLFPLTAKQFY